MENIINIKWNRNVLKVNVQKVEAILGTKIVEKTACKLNKNAVNFDRSRLLFI